MKIIKNAVNKEFDLDSLQENDFIGNTKNCSSIICDQINAGTYSFIEKLVNKDSIVLDIGANIGYFSFYASPLVKEIHAFEPTPETFRILGKTKEHAALNNVVLHNKAVSNFDGNTTFYLYGHNSTMNSLKELSMPNVEKTKISVATVSLKTIIDSLGLKDEQLVDFVKLDIEGGEKIILFDESFEHDSTKIKNIFIEIHEFDTFDTQAWPVNMEINVQRAIKELESCGYKVVRISFDGIVGMKF